MKKLLYIFFLLLSPWLIHSQVGINTTNPNAQLDIKSSNQVAPSNTDGILIPKIDVFPLTNPTSAQHSMVVYLTTTSGEKKPGFYYWDNGTTSWKWIGESKSWALAGNEDTDPLTDFIGTTDNVNLNFKRNNIKSGIIGDTNTALGFESLLNNFTGISNSAFGANSLFSNTNGSRNTANGRFALYANTIYNDNTATGYAALYSSNGGLYNTANGAFSLYSNTIGNFNTANGYSALSLNTSGNYNTANGVFSLNYNSIGEYNTANGYQSLYFNTTGHRNTANGASALNSNTTGYRNTANGYRSLYLNDYGYDNTANGAFALLRNEGGSNNTANGAYALSNGILGNNNTAIGAYAHSSGTGNDNTASGVYSLFVGSGDYNTANGAYALYSNTSTLNTAIGAYTLYSNTSGHSNFAGGYDALRLNTTGMTNTAIGTNSLKNNVVGSGNIAIGYQSGENELGSNKLYIENSNSTTPLIYGEFDNDLIKINGNLLINNLSTSGDELQLVNKNNFIHSTGNQIFGVAGNQNFILSSKENEAETSGVYGDGNSVAIWSPADSNNSQPNAIIYFLNEDTFDGDNNPYDDTALKSFISPVGAYVQISDRNKKENIVKIESATEKINQISGYTYQFKLSSEEISKGKTPIQSSGVLAQELEKILPQSIHLSKEGDYFVDYSSIIPLLIEAIKESNTKIKLLEEQLKSIKESN